MRTIILFTSLLLLAACGSNEEAIADRLRKAEEARKTGYAAWTTRLSVRDQALAAAKARAEEQDAGPAPTPDEAKQLIAAWLSVHAVEPVLETDAGTSPHLVLGQPEARVVGSTSFKPYSWDLAGGPEKVWQLDAAFRKATVDSTGAGWHLYTFTLAPGAVKAVTVANVAAAEPKLKALLGAKY